MPSLPTSLILVSLAAAWLVVLVPMVSRRREEVPEHDEETASFRVLERRDGADTARPVLSRTAMAHRSRGRDEDDLEATGPGDDELGDDAATADGAGSASEGSLHPEVRAAGSLAAERIDAFRAGEGGRLGADEFVGAREEMTGGAAVAEGYRGGQRHKSFDAADDWRAERDRGRMRDATGGSAIDADRRRMPARTGRGGFDPAAADRAHAYRFRQRRRTALALLLLALVGSVLGFFGIGYGYAGAVTAGSLLLLYFAYLRRQVRIEESIRARRAARLERAEQIRPGYRPTVAEQVWMHRTGEIPRPGSVDPGSYQVKSHVRQSVSAAGYGVPVDVEDSDPAFDDLEYYRPAAHRRRAG